ncbi:hypothetical protein AgCh_038183 [Apium graveolens]
MALNIVKATIPEKGTNYLAFTDTNQAPDNFKGFVKFLFESYIAGALTVNPVLYLDVLHEFWTTIMVRTVMNDNSVSLVVTCTIGGQLVEFNEQDVNIVLGLPTANLVEVPTQDELTEFMDFNNYGGRINLSSLNRTNLRNEWSSIFDSIVRAFTCRKTRFRTYPYPMPYMRSNAQSSTTMVPEPVKDFYEDLFEELSKYGEFESLNICDNLADHMVGNVYALFREEEHVAAAVQGLTGRSYAG